MLLRDRAINLISERNMNDIALPVIDQLPTDCYGFFVENDLDARRLLWLVNQIGEQKLRNGVAKYNEKYPDSKPYVSLMLKRYKLKSPVFKG